MEGDTTGTNRKCSSVTGSARKMKDNAADWHNLMLRWERLNDEGFGRANAIVNTRRSQSDQRLVDESETPSSAPPPPPSVPPPPPSSPSSSPPPPPPSAEASDLQDECCKLKEVVDKMVVVVMKMERLMTSQRGVQDLEKFQFGPEGRKLPLFHSWSSKHFEEVSGLLLDSFRQELDLKQRILQEVAHTVSPDLCMVFLSCWLQQPYLPPPLPSEPGGPAAGDRTPGPLKNRVLLGPLKNQVQF
ncbi:hypothetical protein OYC64_009044 [Pagothenia borchgrevinki]|uniref:Cyclin-dependent kinase 2 interacting protein n=1 Tax=Pagothenia borchgrevinki TaxID=8213 RepID=A0ABD2G736_PAGBO